jgi:hypothetical protein
MLMNTTNVMWPATTVTIEHDPETNLWFGFVTYGKTPIAETRFCPTRRQVWQELEERLEELGVI